METELEPIVNQVIKLKNLNYTVKVLMKALSTDTVQVYSFLAN